MDRTIKIIAQELDSKTGEVLNQHIVFQKDAVLPKKINELGFDHKEQIQILQQSQEAILRSQQEIINDNSSICPSCGNKAKKRGKFDSDFHSVFTDHRVTMQRFICNCGWTSKISIDGMYGSALHPDLVEIQSLFGAQNSFLKTEEYLGKRSYHKRAINSHSRIQRTLNQVGELLSQMKQGDDWASMGAANDPLISAELILVIDGAHIKSKSTNKRSFEAITATAYNPKNHAKKDKHHNEITFKTVVASAKQDNQKSIKLLTKNACLKQGMTKDTKLTVLSDGAKNCWSVASDLSKYCKELIPILDWFHIGMKFKNTEHIIPEDMSEEYSKAKWCLWHGNPEKALSKLKEIKTQLTDNKAKLTTLITYIENNSGRIINYQERQHAGLVFTSQLAESTVNTLVNERQKQDKRMQWSRDGSDAVLQVRSSRQSGDWQSDWNLVQSMMYREAV